MLCAHTGMAGVYVLDRWSGFFFLFVTRPLRCPGGACDPVTLRSSITTLRCSSALLVIWLSCARLGRVGLIYTGTKPCNLEMSINPTWVAGGIESQVLCGRRTAWPVRQLVTARLEGHENSTLCSQPHSLGWRRGRGWCLRVHHR